MVGEYKNGSTYYAFFTAAYLLIGFVIFETISGAYFSRIQQIAIIAIIMVISGLVFLFFKKREDKYQKTFQSEYNRLKK